MGTGCEQKKKNQEGRTTGKDLSISFCINFQQCTNLSIKVFPQSAQVNSTSSLGKVHLSFGEKQPLCKVHQGCEALMTQNLSTNLYTSLCVLAYGTPPVYLLLLS